MRLPVSVGSGMRVLASSRWINLRGTPASPSAAASSLPIAASFPVTPSVLRKRIRRLVAACVSMNMTCSCALLIFFGTAFRRGEVRTRGEMVKKALERRSVLLADRII